MDAGILHLTLPQSAHATSRQEAFALALQPHASEQIGTPEVERGRRKGAISQ